MKNGRERLGTLWVPGKWLELAMAAPYPAKPTMQLVLKRIDKTDVVEVFLEHLEPQRSVVG